MSSVASKRVLVTGGAGFIGSHVAEAYLARGYRVWIVDDLSSGKIENVPAEAEFVRMSIADSRLADLFQSVGGFHIVNHHAAQIDVRKSVAAPRMDARINVDGLLNVLEAARLNGTERVIFVSSGGVVYGEPSKRPTPETNPKLPESPYGVTKLVGEQYLYYYHRIHGLEYAALRYANVYGPRQDPHGEAGVVAIFSNRIIAGEEITIFGDGLQTRDYVFIGDVVRANMLLSDADLPKVEGLDSRGYNVGTERETSVVELADRLMDAAGRRVPVRHAEARAGEIRHSCLSAARLRALGWAPQVAIGEGLGITFRHIAGAASTASVTG